VARGDEFVQEMFQDELNSRKLRGSIVLQRPMSDKEFEERLRAHIEQMKRTYPKTQFLTPKRASESSPLAPNYLFYSLLSSDSAHPSFSALSRYFRFTENGEELRGIDISPKVRMTNWWTPWTWRATHSSAYSWQSIKSLETRVTIESIRLSPSTGRSRALQEQPRLFVKPIEDYILEVPLAPRLTERGEPRTIGRNRGRLRHTGRRLVAS